MNTENQNKFESNKKYFTISIYAIFVILIGAILLRAIFMWDATRAVIHSIFSVLSPFLAGAFIAFVMSPLVNFVDGKVFGTVFRIRKNGFRYFLSVLITYCSIIGLVVLFFCFLVPEIWQSLLDLWPSLVVFYETMIDLLVNLDARYPDIDLSALYEAVDEMGQNFLNLNTVKDTILGIIPVLFSTSVGIVNGVFNALISLVVSLYLLWDRKLAAKAARKLSYAVLPRQTANRLIHHIKVCGKMFSGFISGKAIDSTIIGILCYFLMQLLKMPASYISLISVVVGVTNMIPYFGPFMGGFAGGLILLVVAPRQVLIFAVMILALQQFDGLILGPKILGDVIGIRPVWIIFSVTIGGAVGGVIGMFLGVPVVASVLYLLNCYEDYRLKQKDLTLDDETGRPV